ncbi:carbohydrate sulfotransferase 11-like isoform X1 [Euwallacea similis]|uniref:carbohydrate sulfotransferase 11-like isoform X1 n=1 Tax=Euwallacea similis TaxID=1736056 RepID=UPI00344D3A24
MLMLELRKKHQFLVLVFLAAFLPFYETYPWLEQITRQEDLMLGCENLLLNQPWVRNVSQLSHILVDHDHKLLYCYVPKVACTNWKRVMMVLTGQSNVTNLVDIPSNIAHANSSTIRLSELPESEINKILSEYTLFLIVRHPFERLLSAYRNKFEDNITSSRYFQARYGKHIIKKYRPTATIADQNSGDNVSFAEFVTYLLNEGVDTNEHWTPIYDLCLPCQLNYTFIGHYETLSQDAQTILDMVGAPPVVFPVTRAGHTKDKLKEYFQQLSIFTIEHLYKNYLSDFKLFGYGLEDLLGYDLA